MAVKSPTTESMQSLPLASWMAVLQQAEYDKELFSEWVHAERDAKTLQHLATAQPERWTTKLRTIKAITRVLTVTGFSRLTAINLAVALFHPGERTARNWFEWQATNKLKTLKKNGLTVISIAGSYGKTSTKKSVYQVLSSQFYTAATPESINTPLGIARDILKNVTSKHRYYVVELGEYQPGDIDELLRWLRPSIGVLTPIGHAHGSRFASQKAMIQTLQELITSSAAPKNVYIDDSNKQYWDEFPPKTPLDTFIHWYGTQAQSEIQLQSLTPKSIDTAQGVVRWSGSSYSVQTSHTSQSLVRNALPGVLLLHELGVDIQEALLTLRFQSAISRRMEVTRFPNGVTLIDNSYNTNPTAWKQSVQYIQDHALQNVAIITAGFVELAEEERKTAHKTLAKDLINHASAVYIIQTRWNHDLITALQKSDIKDSVQGVLSQDEALQSISQNKKKISVIWLEGGSRELYQ